MDELRLGERSSPSYAPSWRTMASTGTLVPPCAAMCSVQDDGQHQAGSRKGGRMSREMCLGFVERGPRVAGLEGEREARDPAVGRRRRGLGGGGVEAEAGDHHHKGCRRLGKAVHADAREERA